MKPISSSSPAVARALASRPPLSLSAAIGDQLTTLYSLAQRSDHVFGTPLGPFEHAGRPHVLPRFVYFGPHTSEESPRLALLAGMDSRDLRPTLALLHLIEQLAVSPALGQSLHLAFYPLVDVLGRARPGGPRDLADANWAAPTAPEIALLAGDARLTQYHGFIRIESAPADDVVTLRLGAAGCSAPATPLLSSTDTDPFAVRWELEAAGQGGPLTLVEDLPFRPLELTLRVPLDWAPEFYREAVATILQRFIVRYRGLLAYGQHL